MTRAIDTGAKFAVAAIQLLEIILPLLREREQVTALERLEKWTARRRKTIEHHQLRLERRRGQ